MTVEVLIQDEPVYRDGVGYIEREFGHPLWSVEWHAGGYVGRKMM